ncbi:hypothetical protein DPMN_000201 [Dreissena polymorpha]|uniref:Uncharacterized protein n=1 Tax=Dreissena polymorpha TaxID=45954 RepID=A0A9D4RPA8_DREPO|nr:hypothetical protein DPMN_000201 [Dreissena polymorpha]
MKIWYKDSDDSMDEMNACPGCRSNKRAASEWISCSFLWIRMAYFLHRGRNDLRDTHTASLQLPIPL